MSPGVAIIWAFGIIIAAFLIGTGMEQFGAERQRLRNQQRERERGRA